MFISSNLIYFIRRLRFLRNAVVTMSLHNADSDTLPSLANVFSSAYSSSVTNVTTRLFRPAPAGFGGRPICTPGVVLRNVDM